ncbi:hypothetical protein GCM10010109_24750 [Actinoplanes campanulatus]|nr:hypothetical protein GCM10010109_24750 [Actinoplanes campanulatus]GID36815.1 hypothetical protein Aca09nite_33210 [Actinoplanes campanulatus]
MANGPTPMTRINATRAGRRGGVDKTLSLLSGGAAPPDRVKSAQSAAGPL